MAYIKTISELPTWFNISNYQPTYKSAEKLLEQIIYRKALLEFLTNKNTLFPICVEPSEDFYSFLFYFSSVPYIDAIKIEKKRLDISNVASTHYKDLQITFDYAFNKIKVDPLVKNGFGEIKHNYEFCWLLYLKGFISEYLEYDYAPIKDVQLYEIGEKFSMLDSGIAKYLLNEFREPYTEKGYVKKFKERLDLEGNGYLLDDYVFSNEEDELEEVGKKYVESLSSENCSEIGLECGKYLLEYEREALELDDPVGVRPLISIDLSCSDDVIREQFNQWLAKKRISLHEFARENEIDFEIDRDIKSRVSVLDKIYSYRVLAYMDLMLWSELTGNKIKLSVIAHALFPDGEYDAEFVRKILKPLMEKLFSPSSKEVSELMYLKNMENF